MDPWEPMVPQVLLVLPWSLVSFSSAFQCSPSGPTLDVFLSRFFLRSVSQEFQRVSTQHGRHSCPDEVVYSRRCCRRWFSESGRVHPSDRHLNVKKREKKGKQSLTSGWLSMEMLEWKITVTIAYYEPPSITHEYPPEIQIKATCSINQK